MQRLKLAGDWAPYSRTVERLSFDDAVWCINLEGPVLKGENKSYYKASKAGPSLYHTSLPVIAAENAIPGVLILANNHMMDYGEIGYKETQQLVQKDQWLDAGAGSSKRQAFEPVVFDWGDKKVGVLARCEVQYGIASETTPGVAAFDATIFEQIRKLKTEVDIVIASIHAAAEMLPWPSPQRQDTWRALIDAGADIVHGHHAHVPQGWEEYNGGLIFYGLGNFCVDSVKWSWHPNGLWSLAPELSFQQGRLTMNPVTAVIDDFGETISVRTSTQAESAKHHEYLRICNQPLSDRVLLEGLWQEASLKMYQEYYVDWLGFNVPLRKQVTRSVRSALGRVKRTVISRGSARAHNPLQQQSLFRYHLFACESHNDAISTALGILGGELVDYRTDKTAQMVNKMMVSR
ncbi:CapA family protein [Prosthecochloris vibrioformis]|uniref:CapA family protein n=1 Tax=Prosthecochloris vibrioformis TaxID=1098 RepID=A0A5C4S3R4_PROVB|nr:CapA family protein [Prosthecochloris vibrioformis]TNJ37431.1 CapA family protein [Prosthecochloris vibrioformis]